MSEEVFNVALREEVGKRRNRRLRAAGKTPAVLYGHGEESVKLVVPTEELDAALRHAAKFITLKGDLNESALLHDMQFDAFGQEVLHLDLIRVRVGEKIEVEVPIELRGEAPGAAENGVVDQVMHSVMVETTPRYIPEKLELNINELQLGESLTTEALEVPEDVKLLLEEPGVVVNCYEAQIPEEGEEEEALVPESAEPELITKAGEEEEEGEPPE